MNTYKLLAVTVAALATLTSVAARADEADASQFVLKFDGSRTRAEVRAEAIQAAQLGSTDADASQYGLKFAGHRSRDEVRAEAVQAAQIGSIEAEVSQYGVKTAGSRGDEARRPVQAAKRGSGQM